MAPAAEGRHHGHAERVAADGDQPEDGLQHPVLIQVLADDQLQIKMLAASRVDAQAVTRVHVPAQDARDPDAPRVDPVQLEVLSLAGQQHRLLQEGGAHQDLTEPFPLGFAQPVLEGDLALPGGDVQQRRRLAGQPRFEVRGQSVEVAAGATGQLRVPVMQQPGHQLLADGTVEFRVVAGEVRQEAEQIIEDPPPGLVGGPWQLGAVAVQALAERLQAPRLHRAAGDGRDAVLAEEGAAGMNEGRQVAVVVGGRLVQHQDVVGPAAYGLGRVAGQGLEAAPDERAEPAAGHLKALGQLRDGGQRIVLPSEEGLLAEQEHARQG
jgi:hypothetical protein